MDPFYLKHLVLNLFQSRRYQELYELVGDPEWRLEKFGELGSDASFLDDLQWAILSAEQQQVPGLPRLIQYSLLDSLVRALAAVTPVATSEADNDQTGLGSALERAETILDPRKKVEALVSVARSAIGSDQPQVARQALKGAGVLVEKVSGVIIQARLLVEVADAQMDIGETPAAEAGLQQASRLLDSSLSDRTKRSDEVARLAASLASSLPGTPPVQGRPAVNLPPQKPVFAPWLKTSQTPVMRTSATRDSPWVSVAGIYAILAGGWAGLGQRQKAADILARLKPHVRQLGVVDLEMTLTDFSTIDGITAAVRKFIRLGDPELAAQAIDILPPTYGGRARQLLPELARELAHTGQPELAVQLVCKVEAPPLSTTDTADLRDALLARLAAQVDDPAGLNAIAAAAPKTREKHALNAVALRHTQFGRQEPAAQVARQASPATEARIAARMIKQGEPAGQTMLRQALAAGRNQHRPALKNRVLSQIARGLAEEGLVQQALAAWQEAQSFPADSRERADTVATASALVVALTRAGQTEQALALANGVKPVSDRVEVLSAMAATLLQMGNRAGARRIFEVAYSTARGTLNPEERTAALESLVDRLLEASEFELAHEVARSVDRLYNLLAYTDEPGLIFRKAKDWLGRTVGLPEDEDLAIDTSPDFQVKVVKAIAEAGDYKLARRLAAQIKNSSVQDELKSEIAASAARAGDHGVAYGIAKTVTDTTDREIILEELAAEAAQTGKLSQALLRDEEYQGGRALAMTAFAARQAALGLADQARKLMEQVARDVVDQAGEDEDEAVEDLSELIRLAAETGYHDGVRLLLERTLAQIKGMDQTADRAQPPAELARVDLAETLAEIGWLKEAEKLARKCPDWPNLDARLYGLAGHQFARRGDIATALAIADQLTGSDDIRSSAALQLSQQGHYSEASQLARAITHEQIAGETRWGLTTLRTVAQQPDQAGPLVAHLLADKDKLSGLNDETLAALISGLVRAGHYPLARNLMDALPKPEFSGQGGKRGEAARALVQAAIQVPGSTAWSDLLEIIETELPDDLKFSALARLADWVVAAFPQGPAQALEPVFQALAAARRLGHYQVLLHVAGLASLLDGLGGVKLLQQTIDRFRQVEEVWC